MCPITGVERYATDICRILGDRVQLIQPPRYLKGAAGHAWERAPRHDSGGGMPVVPGKYGAAGGERSTTWPCWDRTESYRSWFAAGYQFLLPRLARRVRKIIAVSAFTRGRICERWGGQMTGEMSLVGPRPFLPHQQKFYGAEYRNYIRFRPGLSGMWQVSGRNLLSFQERVELDAFNFQNWTIMMDVEILRRTVGAVLKGEGAL